MPYFIPYEFITHVRKVKNVYKRALRDIQARNYVDRHNARIQCVLMRHEFEKNRNIRDPIRARQLLEQVEEEITYRQRTIPQIIFPDAPDGVTHGRGGSPLPDWLYDYYHPLEKAQYPTYFATREKRKKEFMQWYDRTYGRPTKIED